MRGREGGVFHISADQYSRGGHVVRFPTGRKQYMDVRLANLLSSARPSTAEQGPLAQLRSAAERIRLPALATTFTSLSRDNTVSIPAVTRSQVPWVLTL